MSCQTAELIDSDLDDVEPVVDCEPVVVVVPAEVLPIIEVILKSFPVYPKITISRNVSGDIVINTLDAEKLSTWVLAIDKYHKYLLTEFVPTIVNVSTVSSGIMVTNAEPP